MEPQARWFKPCGIHYRKDFRGWSWTDMICMRRWVFRARLALPAPAKTQTAGQTPNPAAATLQLGTIRSRMWPGLSSRFQAFKSGLCEEKLCTCGRRRSSEHSELHPGEFLELGVGCRESRS